MASCTTTRRCLPRFEKLKARFGLRRVVVVSDRGMVTKANLELMRDADGTGWITALKAPQIQKLARDGALQLSLFDQINLGEITSEDYPGERLVVCRNPLVAAERARKREELLAATERGLAEIAERVKRGTLHGADQIGLAVGPALKRYKVRKHFQRSDHRQHLRLRAQNRTDRPAKRRWTGSTSCEPASPTPSSPPTRSCAPTRTSNRSSARSRPSKAPSSRSARSTTTSTTASARTCSSACSPTTSPGIYAKHGHRCSSKTSSPPIQPDPVAKASRSPAAQRKARTKRTRAGDPCHSYKSLLAELATLTRNTIRLPGTHATFHKLAQPTTLQARALDLAEHAPLDT